MQEEIYRQKTALIVDRSEIVRCSLREILRESGCCVIADTDSLESAVTLFEKFRPDIVALDTTISSDCISYLRKFKEIYPEARVVMISTVGGRGMISESIRAGAGDFMVKPIKWEQLESRIANILMD